MVAERRVQDRMIATTPMASESAAAASPQRRPVRAAGAMVAMWKERVSREKLPRMRGGSACPGGYFLAVFSPSITTSHFPRESTDRTQSAPAARLVVCLALSEKENTEPAGSFCSFAPTPRVTVPDTTVTKWLALW